MFMSEVNLKIFFSVLPLLWSRKLGNLEVVCF